MRPREKDHDAKMRVGDLLPTLRYQITDRDGVPIRLTGGTAPSGGVHLLMTSDEDGTQLLDRAVDILEDADDEDTYGLVEYAWQSGDTDTPGLYHAVSVLNYSTGQETVPKDPDYFYVRISAR